MENSFWLSLLVLIILLVHFPDVYEKAYEYEMRTCIEPCNHTDCFECGCFIGGCLSWGSPESYKNYYENYKNK